jgi:colanic acid/amylovoran biosynthesis glycosyltransferase
MPTVAYLANLFPSATERYIIGEIRELRSRGINVIPCSMRRPSTPLDSDLACWAEETIYLQSLNSQHFLRAAWLCLINSAKVEPFLFRILFRGGEPIHKRIRALAHTFLGACYAAALKNFSIQHIHVHHGYFGSWVAMVAARLLRVSFSMTLHGSDILLDPAYLDLKLELCQLCVTISEFNRRHLLAHYPHVDPHKIVVQRLGVDCARSLSSSSFGRNPSSMAIFSAGRLHPVKNYAFLVRACGELKLRGLNFTCQIAGDGVERWSLEAMIRDFGLQNEVRLLGQLSREQMLGHYAMADLVALTSRSEGIPLVLMEAMAQENIVLAPDITGISELVIDGETGFLYRSGCLTDFVARVEMIYNKQFELDSLRCAARRHVLEHFNREKNLAAFCDRLIANLPKTSSRNPVAHQGIAYENPLLQ